MFPFHNTLEHSEITYTPLEELLTSLFLIDILIFIVIIFLLFLTLNRVIISKNIGNFTDLIEKYLSKNFTKWYKSYVNKSIIYNDRFYLIIIIINSAVLIILLLTNLYVITELLTNLDSYVKGYNYLNK